MLSVMNISPLGSKAKPAGELSTHVVTVVESHGAEGEYGTARAVESDLEDLVEVSVADVKVGAGVIDSEGLREAHALAAGVQNAWGIRCERFPGNLDDARGTAAISDVDVAAKVNSGRSRHSES